MSLEPVAMAHLATGDPAVYRIAADWLLERGDARGEYILDELLLAERPNPSTRKMALLRRAEREKSLHSRIEAPLRALGVTECEYHWGFVQFVRLPEKALGSLPKLLELEPITRLGVVLGDGAGLAETMRSSAFGAIRALEVISRDDPALSVVAPKIDTLTLRPGPQLVQRLGELFPALKKLNVVGRMGGNAAMEAVAKGQLALAGLWAPDAGVVGPSVTMLAHSAARIESLGLAFNVVGGSALKALGASQGLSALRELDLRGRGMGASGFLSTGLPALKKLRMTYPRPSDRALFAKRGISLY